MGFHWEGMRAVPKLYLAFFTVVASRPNLSTFVFTEKKGENGVSSTFI